MIVINETIKEMKTWEEAEKYLAKSGLSQGHVDEQEILWKESSKKADKAKADQQMLAIENAEAAKAKAKAEAEAKKAAATREEDMIRKAERAKLAAERMAARPKRIAPKRGTRPPSRLRGQPAKTNKVAPAIKAATKSIFKSTSPKVSAAPKVSTIEKDD